MLAPKYMYAEGMDIERRDDVSLYRMFQGSVLLKGAICLAEMAVGAMIFFIPVAELGGFLSSLAGIFLPDALATLAVAPVMHVVEGISGGTQAFIAFYLFTRGFVKLIPLAAVLRNQLWAFPASLFIISLFVLYQLYQIATTGSGFIIALTIFDLVVMALIWREWRIARERFRTLSN